MKRISVSAPITAIVYDPGARIDGVLASIVTTLQEAGAGLAGFVQINPERKGRSHCDMVLEDLASRTRVAISEDRGPEARGCRLDMAELVRAAALAAAALDHGPDLVVINKFGKTEATGGGFRTLMAEAIERGIPVLAAVPRGNLEAWRVFTGGLAMEHALDTLASDPRDAARQLGLRVCTTVDAGAESVGVHTGL